MNRLFQRFLGISFGAFVVSTAFVSWGRSGDVSSTGSETVETAAKPNVVFILTDDLGYGDLSCYGQEKFETVRIDELASEGIRFTQFYAGATVCAPSRCSLTTGLHGGRAFIRGNRGMTNPTADYPLAPEYRTVADVFKDNGYATGAFGKWGLGHPAHSGGALEFGFDEFFGYYSQAEAHDYYPNHLYHNAERIELDEKTYSHDLIEANALRFIRENAEADRPFFCYMPLTIPHAAMQVPEEYMKPWREKYPEFEDRIVAYGSRQRKVRNPIAAFPAMISRLDETVGKVLDELKELGIDEETIVIFSSDNGPHREGGHDSAFWKSSGAFRGIKRDLYEGGIRVPFIVRWPGKIAPSQTSELQAAFWDFLPTVCDLLNADVPNNLAVSAEKAAQWNRENDPQAKTDVADYQNEIAAKVDGISFLPTLLGDSSRQRTHEYLYWEFYEQGGKKAARRGDWKAVRLNVSKNPDGPIELYNLADDPSETANVADRNPEIVREFDKIFEEARWASPVFQFAPKK